MIDKKLFVYLFFAFIAMTIIGTQAHEMGHYLVARSLGYQSSIHIGYTKTASLFDSVYNKTWWRQHLDDLNNNRNFPGKQAFIANNKIRQQNSFYIILGGPLQTMLSGTLGVILLLFYRKKFFHTVQLRIRQWALIFLSLFWLRQPANAVTGLIMRFTKGKFGTRGDEIFLAHYWHLPFYSIIVVTGIIGTIISTIVIFKFIPSKQRLTFIIAGFFAGMIGFLFWLVLLGPVSF